jgi:SAM-dependent methyltransferase
MVGHMNEPMALQVDANASQARPLSEAKQRLAEYFDGIASGLVPWKRNRYYHAELARFVSFVVPDGLRVLEIGCGAGDLLASTRPRRGMGVDLSPRMVELASRRHPDLSFTVADAEDLSIDHTFDYVILADLIGYLEDVQAAFDNLHRVTTTESRIVITYFNYLWEPVLRLAQKLGLMLPQRRQNWLAVADIVNLLFLSDFEVITSGYRLLLPQWIPGVSWLANRVIAKVPGIRKLCLVQYVIARPVSRRPAASANYSVSVVVPCRNERGNIQNAVERMPRMGSSTEIVFVDGNSTDGTAAEIERVSRVYAGRQHIRLLHQGKGIGKGDAVRKGFAASEGEILMILDADLTVPPEDLPKFYDALVSGKGEFINGTRLVYPMERQAMRTLNLLGNKFFSLAFTWLLDQRFRDTLCGTKVLFKRDYDKIAANRHYFGDFDPFGDFDLIFGASKQNLKIVEVPVRYRERTYGTTNISRFRHGWLLLRMCVVAFYKLKLT